MGTNCCPLTSVWEAAGYPWSVRLKALLPGWMPWIRKRFKLSPEISAHIEQENWTHVRKLLGWERYDRQNAVAAMNALYRKELRLWLNLYLPSVKLVKKVRVGSKLRRVYDAPKTPFERVMASKQANATQLSVLKELQRSLDPFQLAKVIDRKLERIYRQANRRLSPKPQEKKQSRQVTPGRRAGRKGSVKDSAKAAGANKKQSPH